VQNEWHLRKLQLDQCLQLQLFEYDIEQVEYDVNESTKDSHSDLSVQLFRGGAVAKLLEGSPLVLKVPGSKHGVCQKSSEGFFCSPRSKWIPDFSGLGKVEPVRKRNSAPPQLHHCRCKLAL